MRTYPGRKRMYGQLSNLFFEEAPIGRSLLAVVAVLLFLLTAAVPADAKRGFRYTVNVRSITAQPLSQSAIVLHDGNYQAVEVGSFAGPGLAELAMDGNPGEFLRHQHARKGRVYKTVRGPETTGSSSISFRFKRRDVCISFVAKAMNTNDGIANSKSCFSRRTTSSTTAIEEMLDAGVEANNELSAYIPGPCCTEDGGRGRRSVNLNLREPERDHIEVLQKPGILGVGDLDPGLFGWGDTVATVEARRDQRG